MGQVWGGKEVGGGSDVVGLKVQGLTSSVQAGVCGGAGLSPCFSGTATLTTVASLRQGPAGCCDHQR